MYDDLCCQKATWDRAGRLAGRSSSPLKGLSREFRDRTPVDDLHRSERVATPRSRAPAWTARRVRALGSVRPGCRRTGGDGQGRLQRGQFEQSALVDDPSLHLVSPVDRSLAVRGVRGASGDGDATLAAPSGLVEPAAHHRLGHPTCARGGGPPDSYRSLVALRHGARGLSGSGARATFDRNAALVRAERSGPAGDCHAPSGLDLRERPTQTGAGRPSSFAAHRLTQRAARRAGYGARRSPERLRL